MNAAQMFEVDPHESDVYCIPSSNRNKVNSEIKQICNFDLGSALESYIPLLETVFDYLDYNDLTTCMLVNNVWKDLAAKALKKRHSVGWISFMLPGGILHSSKFFNYSNVSNCIIFYDYHCIKLNKYVCLHEDSDLKKMTFVEYIAKEVVPKNIDHCLLSCSSVTPIYLSESVARKKKTSSKTRRAVFQSVSLPEIPNVNISLFHCTPKNVETIKESFSKHIKPNEEIKCLLLFTIQNPYRFIKTFLCTVLDGRKPEQLAFGGGIIKGFKTFLKSQDQKMFRASDYFCIAFHQEKGKSTEFNSASVVIPGDYLTEQEFEEYLERLKLKCQKRLHGVAFRFCCAAKYSKDMETSLFSKHFPSIPLLGIDADGEMGWNTKNLQDDDGNNLQTVQFKNKKIKKDLPEMQHQWSTIIVLLTWGKLVNNGKF